MASRYGMDRVRAILGDGVKRLAASERANYSRTNRSIHYARSLEAGERIGIEDIAMCRLDASDVVRHRLVGEIVDAYGRWDESQSRTSPGRRRNNRSHTHKEGA